MRKMEEVQEELKATRLALGLIQKRLGELYTEERTIRESKSTSSTAAAKNRQAIRAEKWAVPGAIVPGDFVRVVGGRNSRWNWRQVVEVTKFTITGRQASRRKDGTFALNDVMTKNGLANVAEVVRP